MISPAIDTFYLTDEQLQNSPSRKDGIDEATETTLRIYGCDLIQECSILLKLPQAAISTAQVLFHRFYCKKSFSRFNVKRVAASCVYLAAKLEEDPRKAKHVIIVFHRAECRRENLPIQHLDLFSTRYQELREDLTITEMSLLVELGFVCHVEHPHKFILTMLSSLARLGTALGLSHEDWNLPPELSQEAWNLANDSLRTTLCVRFRSNVVACGVVYAAARRFQVPLPEDPLWWEKFGADISGINEVCRVLARLYTLPRAQYIPVCREGESFKSSNTKMVLPKEGLQNGIQDGVYAASAADNPDFGGLKGPVLEVALGKLKEAKRSTDDSKSAFLEGEPREAPVLKHKTEHRPEANREKNKWGRGEEILESQDRCRGSESVPKYKTGYGMEASREKWKARDSDRGRDSVPKYRTGHRMEASQGKNKEHECGREGEKLKSRDRDRDYYRRSHSGKRFRLAV